MTPEEETVASSGDSNGSTSESGSGPSAYEGGDERAQLVYLVCMYVLHLCVVSFNLAGLLLFTRSFGVPFDAWNVISDLDWSRGFGFV